MAKLLSEKSFMALEIESYVKANTTELDTQIKVANATTFIEI